MAESPLDALVTLSVVDGALVATPLTEATLRERMAAYTLAPAVPDHVRTILDRCRAAYVAGAEDYGLFTSAMQQASIALEAVLGARFLAHYPGGVPLSRAATGDTALLSAGWYNEIPTALRTAGMYPRGDGWRLAGYPQFDGSLRALLGWARAEGLLYGQRNRVRENALLGLRNFAAHQHSPLTVMPGDAGGTIAHVTAIANHLWGDDASGGIWYGPQPPMALWAVQQEPSGARMVCQAAGLEGLPPEERAGRWLLIVASVGDNLLVWPEGNLEAFDLTAYPAEMLWAGDSWEGAVAEWRTRVALGWQPTPREYRDRSFLIHYQPDIHDPAVVTAVEPCHSHAQLRDLCPPLRDRAGWRWALLRADHPTDAVNGLPDCLRRLHGRKVIDELPTELIGTYPNWVAARQQC